MKMFKEFKEFITKGSVIDLAIGVIIGGAFAAITASLVGDIIMPIVGMLLGGVDFNSWIVYLPNLYGGDPIPMTLGIFINTVINFVIIAFVVFLIVKGINKFRKKKEAEAAPPEPTKEEVLLAEIRDILKDK